jgi:hypothetical protein
MDIAVAVIFVVLIVVLVRAAKVLSANPYQQIRSHEDLASGKFPSEMSLVEKQRLIDMAGISPTSPRRIWLTVAVAIGGFLVLLIWQRWGAP